MMLPRLGLAAALSLCTAAGALSAPAANTISFNEHMIEGLKRQLDLADPLAVFRLVFEALDTDVVVYPTENYYYFKFDANGRTIAGNLRLDASDRDDGIIHLGYFEYDETGLHQDRDGKGGPFDAADGVDVVRLDRFTYAVTAFDRTVRFHLDDHGRDPPPDGMLRAEETFIGRLQDESGLAFFLLFEAATSHFMYVLDDATADRETFLPSDPDVSIGRRTGFAFYEDRARSRRVLVAVNGRNTDRNNYFDGPFDQLPDNHVEESNLGDFIERAYPHLAGHIDRFGHFTSEQDARVAITPYYVYYDPQELQFVGSCRQSIPVPSEFYACITPDFQQLMASAPAQPADAAVPSDGALAGGQVSGSVR
ncbi:hypothetical protein [Devosia sp. CN2-171]|uniref:hypothetical protein n=1 Tax=Devosia sp. CN2-171 TaxID=3400909 RepID=UPI003BF87678